LSTISELPSQARILISTYVDLVRAWAPRLDLVVPGDLGRFETRHVEDALKAVEAVGSATEGVCIDVGSGAGIPGVPLAIATARPWRLLEPRRRRAAFLEEVTRELELDAEVVSLSAAEAAAQMDLTRHALATARALAPPPEALALCRPLVKPGGSVLLWVGQRSELPPEAEVSAGGLASIRVESR
jgi:16S rRNA (guanine527-N7)-methyltransferase